MGDDEAQRIAHAPVSYWPAKTYADKGHRGSEVSSLNRQTEGGHQAPQKANQMLQPAWTLLVRTPHCRDGGRAKHA